jgi:class 3 adenylate cyclase
LTVDERQIDFWYFTSLVQRARTVQADSRPDETAALLRAALALWRGPVLADLAEAGFPWPELRAAENTRLDALEDYFDAELGRGRHESVLTELQASSLAEPLRERLLGQFMLALYRCGRQAEALNMYEKAEAALDQTFGIEPGRDLRELYRSIRADDSLLLAGRSDARSALSNAGAQTEVRPTIETTVPTPVIAERRRASLLHVRVDPSQNGTSDPEQLDDVLARVGAVIQPQAERFGGVILARLGSHWLIVFGVPRSHHDDARRAVLCALAIRSSLESAVAEHAGHLRIVVSTGLVLARFQPGTQCPPSVTGAPVDACHSLLPFVGPKEIWVTDDVYLLTGHAAYYERARISSGVWVVIGARLHSPTEHVPMIGHKWAWDTLMSALDRFLLHRTPAIVTVHGDPGMGKSRLIAEFERMAAIRTVGQQQVPIVRLPVVLDDAALAVTLIKCCGITGDDLPEVSSRKLRDFIRRTAETDGEAEWMIATLQFLLHRTSLSTLSARADRVTAWWLLLERIAALRPLVLIVDDVEFAEDDVLRFVERITRSGQDASVFVIADARPTPAHRRPIWVEAQRRAISATLLPLSASDMEVLVEQLLDAYGLVQRSKAQQPQNGVITWLTRSLVTACHGNPAFAHDYVALIHEAVRLESDDALSAGHTIGVLPPVMERMTAERVDRLPAVTRAVLQDAAAACPAIWSDAVAAAGDWDHEAVQPHLDELVRRGILLKSETDPVSGNTLYEFQSPADRHVVHSQLPLALQARKRANVIAWIDGLPECRLYLVLDHYRRVEQRITAILGSRPGELVVEELPVIGDSARDATRGPADEAVRRYVALAEIPSWYRARLKSIAGELRIQGNAGRAVD